MGIEIQVVRRLPMLEEAFGHLCGPWGVVAEAPPRACEGQERAPLAGVALREAG